MNKFIYFLLLFYLLSNITTVNANLSQERLSELTSLSLEQLMEINITTAGKVAEKLGEIPASVVLVTRQEIERYGYTTLDDILQHISGVYSLDAYALGGNTYGIRGYLSTSSANRNIIILVNGVSQILDYDATYLVPNTAVPVEVIDRVEIVRGPQSTVYGSGAFFGVINIITNEIPQKLGLSSYVAASGGSQARRESGRIYHVYEKGDMVLNVGHYHDRGIEVPYSRLETKPIALEAGLTTEGRLEQKQKYVGLSGHHQNFYYDFSYSDVDKEGFASNPTIGEGTVRVAETTRLRLGYKTTFFEQWSLDSKLTYIKNDSSIYYDGPFTIQRDKNFQDENSVAYEGEMTLRWQSPYHFDMTTGLYYRYVPKISTYIDLPALPNAVTLQKATQRLNSGEAFVNRALFSQLNYSPSEKWKWVAGLRLEQTLGYGAFAEYGRNPAQYRQLTPYYEQQDLAVIPRLAMIYTPNDRHIFKWMYGKAINVPSFGQNTSTRLTTELPPLEAEEIETTEFNYLTYLSPRYMLNTNFFRNHLKKLLERTTMVTPAGQYLNFLGNGGEYDTYGLELNLQAHPSDDSHLELGFTYQKTRDSLRPELTAAYSPALLGQFKWSYQWNPHLSFGITTYFVSAMEVFFDPTLVNSDGSFGRRIRGTPSDHYWVTGVNMRVSDWLTKGTVINLHINNVFDEEIVYPTYTRNSWADRGTVGQERAFMLTVGYEF